MEKSFYKILKKRIVFELREEYAREAFIYTFLEACNSITNYGVYQSLMNALQPFRIKKKTHF